MTVISVRKKKHIVCVLRKSQDTIVAVTVTTIKKRKQTDGD